MPKSVRCKFYAIGSCLKGEYCDYAHDSSPTFSNVCSYYQKGQCLFGSRCRYEHVNPHNTDSYAASTSASASRSNPFSPPHPIMEQKASASRSNPFSAPHTIMGQKASASRSTPFSATHPIMGQKADRKQETTTNDASNACPTCGVNGLEDERESHIEKCEKKQKQVQASEEIECGVCLDKVLSKTTPVERKFGVLSECDHPFCISCIKNWRSSSSSSGYEANPAVRSCPVCRRVSYFVIPSVIWFTTKEEKQEIVNSYKSRLRSIDCKHFDFGNGNCPFGNSCFYKHTVNPGSFMWKYNRPPGRRRRNSDVSGMIEFGELCDLFQRWMDDDDDDDDFFDFGDYDNEDGFDDLDDDYLSFGLFDSSSDDGSPL